MAAGTSAPTAKTQLIALLDARSGTDNVRVTYEPPASEDELKGATGNFDAIWVGGCESNDVKSEVMVSLPLWVDEDYTVELVVQVMREDTDGTQAVVDARAAVLLGEIVGLICSNPTLSVTAFDQFEVRALSWQMHSGFLPGGSGHGCRFDVHVRFNARLKLS